MKAKPIDSTVHINFTDPSTGKRREITTQELIDILVNMILQLIPYLLQYFFPQAPPQPAQPKGPTG